MMDWRLVDWFGRRVPAEWKKRWVRALPDAGGQWVPDPPPGAAVVVLAYRPIGVTVDGHEHFMMPTDRLALTFLPEVTETIFRVELKQPAGVDRAVG